MSNTSSIGLFSNLTITGSAADITRPVPPKSRRLSIALLVQAISGGSVTFSVQWSFNAGDWFDANPADLIGTTTTPAGVIQVFDIKATYWRLVASLDGIAPSVTVTGNALYLS